MPKPKQPNKAQCLECSGADPRKSCSLFYFNQKEVPLLMDRRLYLEKIHELFRVNPVVALLGSRQSGKTTLASDYISGFHEGINRSLNYFDLEDPVALGRLEQAKLSLQDLTGLVVIDEIQRLPEIFPLLRTLVDRRPNPAQFLVLGSASRDLINQSSETLAGRISFLEVHPFGLMEIDRDASDMLWLRGGYPPSFLAANESDSWEWRKSYIRTFLERDIPQLGFNIPSTTISRFWNMLSHYNGQIFNASEIGKSLGIGDQSATRYFDLLDATFMVRRLKPWHENIKKRQVKRPKLYFRDSGILHQLMGLISLEQLKTHPKLGASWEAFALEQVIQLHQASPEEAFFWAVHAQSELDLLIIKDGKRLGFEIKYSQAPGLTDSMRTSFDTLHLDSLTVVVPGDLYYPLADNIEVRGLKAINSACSKIVSD